MISGGTTIRPWNETDLWIEISRRTDPESESTLFTLQQLLPRIESILMQGGTAPLDFTLHDAGHAFRVAERMHQLIPADVLPNMQVFELSILLLSAYLHDMGMTPEQRKVSQHYNYLLTGSLGSLSPDDIRQFQTWLDDEGEEIIPPLSQTKPTAEALRRATELITHYCRYRHNDWGEEWIRSHMGSESLGTYATWLEDLIALCRSHHYGYGELASSKFDPKIVGNPAQVLNLRYLAMLLRVADVLEFDPERA